MSGATVIRPDAFHTPERKIRLMLSSLPFFAGLLSTDGTVLECNFAPLGAPLDARSDWIGLSFETGEWWNYSEDSRSDILIMMGRAREGERVSKERLYRRPDGAMGVMTLTLVPLFALYGQPDAILVMAVDVTERRRASDTSAHVALDMAHRLRNSFTIMRTLATRAEPAELDDDGQWDRASRTRLSQRLSRIRQGHALAYRYLFFGIPIEDVIRTAVPDERVQRADITPVSIPSEHVEALLLALGELSHAGRDARIGASRHGDARLRIDWTESGPRPDSAMPGPLSRLLMDDALAVQTGGTVSLVNDADGFRWSLDMPVETPVPSSTTT